MRDEFYAGIDRLVREHIDQRGLGQVASLGALRQASRQLSASRSVLIVTGFPVRARQVGETDGPIGALSLAYALERLGKPVVILTDRYSCALIASGMGLLGLESGLHCLPLHFSRQEAIRLLDRFNPSHLVSVERPGRAKDGRIYSMRGEDLSDLTPGIDDLFEVARERNRMTIAIGDGGNELGMGRIADLIEQKVPHGRIIANRTRADLLIVAGVSNWGAHGLVSTLSLEAHRCLLYPPDQERALLEELVAHGAVDGVTQCNESSVDGYGVEENQRIFESFHRIVKTSLDREGSIH